MNDNIPARPGALSVARMREQLASFPDYRAPAEAPALRFAAEARRLWGGRVVPLMADPQAGGRFSRAVLGCPPSACTGLIECDGGVRSHPWRSPAAIENIVSLDDGLQVRFGPALADAVTLGRFDMLSVPAGVRHQLVNPAREKRRALVSLSIVAGGGYEAVFDPSAAVDAGAAAALGVCHDTEAGAAIGAEEMAHRLTRFAELVPYKADLSRTAGLPPEATASLSAGSVFPLIVPQGHAGRSRTAPVYGHQGLYMSIAECRAGDDGPPPHAHSDTQESFFVLEGRFEICTGFDNEAAVQVGADDLLAVPSKVMRTFRKLGDGPARLLVIIQGPERMNDAVCYSRRIGEEFERRFGRPAIEAYARIGMTFDAEDRLARA